jgi:sugar (pentulose or hexulose) kinase
MADVSAFGAALLAGLGGEIFPSLEALTQSIPHANTVIPNPGRFQAIKAEYDKWNRLVMEGLV